MRMQSRATTSAWLFFQSTVATHSAQLTSSRACPARPARLAPPGPQCHLPPQARRCPRPPWHSPAMSTLSGGPLGLPLARYRSSTPGERVTARVSVPMSACTHVCACHLTGSGMHAHAHFVHVGTKWEWSAVLCSNFGAAAHGKRMAFYEIHKKISRDCTISYAILRYLTQSHADPRVHPRVHPA